MHFPLPSTLHIAVRALLFVTICQLSACVSNNPANYISHKTDIAESKEWRMPLNREPGRAQFKLHFTKTDVTVIALLPAKELGEGPIRLVFVGGECSPGPEAHIKFYTNRTESFFKYFKTTLQWGSDVDVAIEWDANALTALSVNGEKIEVPAYIPFEIFRFRTHNGSTTIKELSYLPTTAAAPSTTQGLSQ